MIKADRRLGNRMRLSRYVPGVIVVLTATLLVVSSTATTSNRAAAGSTAGQGALKQQDLLDGLAAWSWVQSVSGSAWSITYCPSSQVCVDPIGVTYLPAANLVVLTTGQEGSAGGGVPGAERIIEINAPALTIHAELTLACIPGFPFYPGAGIDVFIPCGESVLIFDYQANSIVANISLGIYSWPATYDSHNGMIYVGGADPTTWQDDMLASISSTTQNLTGVYRLNGTNFEPSTGEAGYTLVYDPATDSQIVPSATNGLRIIEPSTRVTISQIHFPGYVQSLAIDMEQDELFVSVWDYPALVSSVLVFDASTYAELGSIPIPNCRGSWCDEPNGVGHVMFDPAHGDAYLESNLGLIAVNLSTLSTVGMVGAWYGVGSSTVYAASTGQVFGTWGINPDPNSGVLVQLSHGGYWALTGLFWLPAATGILVLAVAVGLTVAVLFRLFPRTKESRPIGDRPPP